MPSPSPASILQASVLELPASAKTASAANPAQCEPPIPPTNSKHKNHAKTRKSFGAEFFSLGEWAVIGKLKAFSYRHSHSSSNAASALEHLLTRAQQFCRRLNSAAPPPIPQKKNEQSWRERRILLTPRRHAHPALGARRGVHTHRERGGCSLQLPHDSSHFTNAGGPPQSQGGSGRRPQLNDRAETDPTVACPLLAHIASRMHVEGAHRAARHSRVADDKGAPLNTRWCG